MKSTPNAAERLSFLSTKLSEQPHASALLEWSELMLEQGKAKEALQKLASAQAKYAMSYRFHVILARAHRAAGNVPKAKEAYEKACALAPQNEIALRELIMLESPAKSVVKSVPAPAPRPIQKPIAQKSVAPALEQAVVEDAVSKNLDALKYKKPEPSPLPMQIAIDPISAEEFFKEMNTDIIDNIDELMPKDAATKAALDHAQTPSPDAASFANANAPLAPTAESTNMLELPKELETMAPYPLIEESVDAIRIDEPAAAQAGEMSQSPLPPLKRDDVPVFEEVKVLQPEGAVQLDKEKLSKALSKIAIAPIGAKPKPDAAPAFSESPTEERAAQPTAFADSHIEELAAALSNVKMTPVEEMSDPTPIVEQRQPVPDEADIKFPTRNLAEIFVSQGAFAKAIKVYEQLAEKEPQNALLFGIIINGLRSQLK